MKTKIKVKLSEGAIPLEIIDKGDWIDLRTLYTVVLEAPKTKKVEGRINPSDIREIVNFDYQLIDLGVAMELPKGYEAWVVSRSSGPKKNGIELANCIGIIDNSYHGDKDIWRFYARATRDTVINGGTRIAQFRIQLSQKATVWQKIKWLLSSGIEIEYVDHLEGNNRGGNGSTGEI